MNTLLKQPKPLTLAQALLIGDSVVMKVPNTGGLAHFLTMEAADLRVGGLRAILTGDVPV